MSKYIEYLIKQLNELYKVYENHLWNNANESLLVYIGKDKNDNDVISYYLNSNEEIIDEFIISFNKSENELYQFLSFAVTAITLGNVVIHEDKDILYNLVHKPYLKN